MEFRDKGFVCRPRDKQELETMNRDSQVRSYEDCAAGVWDGTGFVVSLENPKAGIGALGF